MHIPMATYRIQFNPAFGFQSLRRILPYLADLGISDIYASPVFKARKGSPHGYDIVDPSQLNPELGTEDDFSDLTDEVKRNGLGWIQDVVPNHMAFAFDNKLLMDVLESGQGSKYFQFFDIDWEHDYENLKGRVLAPFLGRFYGEALEDAEIRLEYGEEGFDCSLLRQGFSCENTDVSQCILQDFGVSQKQAGRRTSRLHKASGGSLHPKNLGFSGRYR